MRKYPSSERALREWVGWQLATDFINHSEFKGQTGASPFHLGRLVRRERESARWACLPGLWLTCKQERDRLITASIRTLPDLM